MVSKRLREVFSARTAGVHNMCQDTSLINRNHTRSTFAAVDDKASLPITGKKCKWGMIGDAYCRERKFLKEHLKQRKGKVAITPEHCNAYHSIGLSGRIHRWSRYLTNPRSTLEWDELTCCAWYPIKYINDPDEFFALVTSSETYFRQDLFPSYLFFRCQFHAIVIFCHKSISDLGSGSLPRFFWSIHTRKINNRGVATTTGREMAKNTLTSG